MATISKHYGKWQAQIRIKDYPNQRNFINKPNENIIPFDFSITETERTSRLEHRPGIIWFTGL